jgi:O-acetyl-ADP-ribose deacetylase (regulator of RNase III)
LLTSCYRRALEVADELGALSVAFPLISSGIYGWPRLDAIAAAVETIAGTATRVTDVRIVAFDAGMYDAVREQLSTYQ